MRNKVLEIDEFTNEITLKTAKNRQTFLELTFWWAEYAGALVLTFWWAGYAGSLVLGCPGLVGG